MTSASDRQYDFDNWIIEIQRKYPDCDVRPTRWGCALYDEHGKFVADIHYEPDPDREALARY